MNQRVIVAGSVLSGLLLTILAGCGTVPDALPSGADGAGPQGRTFLSNTVTDHGTPKDLVAGTRIRLTFHDDGRLTANAGCNSISGATRLDSAALTVENLETTDMGCSGELHRQDEWLTGFLRSTPAWQLAGDELTLEHDGIVLRLTDRAAAEPAAALTNTRWVVDTLITGDMAQTVPAGTAAFLVFATDNTVTGSTGCNTLSGVATPKLAVGDSTITFGPLTTTRKACSDNAMTLERAVLAVLHDTVRYQIEHRTLALTDAGGAGLRLTTG
jgi:heat shock protein HslJ